MRGPAGGSPAPVPCPAPVSRPAPTGTKLATGSGADQSTARQPGSPASAAASAASSATRSVWLMARIPRSWAPPHAISTTPRSMVVRRGRPSASACRHICWQRSSGVPPPTVPSSVPSWNVSMRAPAWRAADPLEASTTHSTTLRPSRSSSAARRRSAIPSMATPPDET